MAAADAGNACSSIWRTSTSMPVASDGLRGTAAISLQLCRCHADRPLRARAQLVGCREQRTRAALAHTRRGRHRHARHGRCCRYHCESAAADPTVLRVPCAARPMAFRCMLLAAAAVLACCSVALLPQVAAGALEVGHQIHSQNDLRQWRQTLQKAGAVDSLWAKFGQSRTVEVDVIAGEGRVCMRSRVECLLASLCLRQT